MSKAVSDLVKFLQGTKGAWRPTTTAFPEVDVNQLAQDMELVARGTERAKDAHCLLDDKGRDPVEREIVEDVRQRAREARNDYNTQLDLYESRLRDASVGDEAFVRIKAVAEEGLANFKSQVEEDKLLLRNEDQRVGLICRQFNAFVVRNRLEDVAPHVLDAREVRHGWLWIAVIVLMESILNGVFFAQGSEAGLIGGIAEAFLLAASNIGLAAGLGLFALRFVAHVSLLWKITAALAIVILLAGVLGLNLLVAHYREAFAFSAGEQVDFKQVLQSLQDDTFGLSDSRSWLLGFMGILLNIFAIYKFYRLQDRYPGFGRLAARRDQAITRLIEERRSCIQVLTHHRDAAADDMTEIITVVSARRHEFELALRSRDRLHNLFGEYLDGLESVAVRLGLIYRHQFRGVDGASQMSSLSAELDPPPDIQSAYTNDDDAHKRAINTMSEYIERISREYVEAVESVNEVVHLKDGVYAHPQG